MSMSSGDRGISDVVQDIFGNIQDIVRSEVRLAKTELREEIAKTGRAALFIAIGGMIGFLAIVFLLVGVLFALASIVPYWSAALIIALILMSGCAICMIAGARLLRRIRLAPVTTASLKENVEWAKQQIK